MEEKLRQAVNEVDVRPRKCPWFGERKMFNNHAPKKHPERYEEWKKNHKKKELNISYWVEEENQ